MLARASANAPSQDSGPSLVRTRSLRALEALLSRARAGGSGRAQASRVSPRPSNLPVSSYHRSWITSNNNGVVVVVGMHEKRYLATGGEAGREVASSVRARGGVAPAYAYVGIQIQQTCEEGPPCSYHQIEHLVSDDFAGMRLVTSLNCNFKCSDYFPPVRHRTGSAFSTLPVLVVHCWWDFRIGLDEQPRTMITGDLTLTIAKTNDSISGRITEQMMAPWEKGSRFFSIWDGIMGLLLSAQPVNHHCAGYQHFYKLFVINRYQCVLRQYVFPSSGLSGIRSFTRRRSSRIATLTPCQSGKTSSPPATAETRCSTRSGTLTTARGVAST